MKESEIPYGKTFQLKAALVDVECWNFSTPQRFTVPAGLLVRLDTIADTTHTTVCVVDEAGEASGIELGYVPTFHHHIPSTHDRTQRTAIGYRFIVENQILGEAIGIEMPKTTSDLVGDLIAYETGTTDDKTTKRLFKTLKKTGIGSRLQGHYSSRMEGTKTDE
jgi:hypothetical protein